MKSADPQGWKHIVWDWNGTLLDDAFLSVACVNKLLEAYNLPPLTAERYEQVFGFPVIDYYRRIGFDFDKISWAEVADAFIKDYQGHRFDCPLRTDARDVLAACRDRGITQSVLSAYQQAPLEEMIRHFDLTGFFSHITGLNDYYAKSKIAIGKGLINTLPYEPAEVVLVGDTVHDFETAQAMAVSCVLVTCGHQSRESLESTGCPVVGSLTEFLEMMPS